MSEDAKIIIDVDIDTGKLEKELDKVLNEYTKKKIELDLQLKDQSYLRRQLKSLDDQIKSINGNPPTNLTSEFNKLKEEFSQSIIKSVELKNQLNSLSKEYRTLNGELKRTSVAPQLDNIKNSFKNFNLHALNSSRYVDYFGRRIFNLLRNAFVFNIISRQFRWLSALLGNLVNRDIYFAKSLMIVQANLIRAFSPIWRIILPWIRALGDGLVWISNQLIRFINFLTGSNIKPLQGFQDAKQVVDDFKRISSPTKDLFDLKDPNKYAKQLKDNIKSSQQPSNKVSKNANKLAKNLLNSRKQTTKLLASFDKLEVLKFEKIKDPLGINELSDPKNLSNNKGIDIPINIPSVEDQISNAINNIQDKPLNFYVNDNLSEQITSQVNGLTLPALNFEVDENSVNALNSFKEKISEVWNWVSKLNNKIVKLVDQMINSEALGVLKEISSFLLRPLLAFLKWIIQNDKVLDILANGIIAIGTALTTALIAKKILGILAALGKLVKFAISVFDLSNPAGWIALAIAGLTLVITHWDKIKETATNVFNTIKDAGTKFVHWINDVLSKSFGGLYDIVKKVFGFIGKIGSFIGNPFDFSSMFNQVGRSNQLSVPGLAQGSVLKGGDPFLAYLNDQPRGQTNVEAPLSTIVEAFKQALSESNYNNQPDITINASGDMSSFIRMLNFKLQDENNRLGGSFVNTSNF